MKLFHHYFKPYAEYTVNTTLTEAELKSRIKTHLQKETFSATFRVMQSEDGVKIFRTADPLVLTPYLFGQNTLRGIIHIQYKTDDSSHQNTLYISIMPKQTSLFAFIICTFSALIGIFMLLLGIWQAIIPLLFIGIAFAFLRLCRTLAEREIPHIRRELENTLRALEK